MNSCFKFVHAGEDTPIQCPSFQLLKPALHGVQPRSTGRREVQLETRMVLQPLTDGLRFVSRAVVQNDMQVKLRVRAPVDLLQKSQKLYGTLELGYPPEDQARQDVKSGIHAGGARTLIIIRASFNLTGA